MFWASSKARALVALLVLLSFSLATSLSVSAWAESGVVTGVGTGRDAPEAIANLLKVTLGKYFKEQPAQLTKTVLQAEILPNASSFVQSYKILEGGKPGSVQLSASVDLDVINGLMSFSPAAIGEADGAKAIVLVRGVKLPDSVLGSLKAGTPPPDPFAPLAAAARERFARRDFAEATLTTAELQQAGAGEDISSPELLRGLGSKAGARVALGISGRYETFENENSHNKDERLVLTATMVDVKAGNVIARASVNVVNPKTRKEQYVADLQRGLLEESKDLFQDVFVAAGRRLVKSEAQASFTVVRVQFPSNGGLVLKFKGLLEAVPGIRSVTDYSVSRGRYDLAVRPALPEAALAKAVAGLQSPEITITVLQALASDPAPQTAALTVKLAPKDEGLVTPPEGAPNAKR